jgi:uncharacterized protein
METNTVTEDNIALAKQAWTHGHVSTDERQASDLQPLFDLFDEDIVFKLAIPDGTPLSGEFRGKQAVMDLYTRTVPELFEDSRLEGPIEFFGNGDQVLLLCTQSYTVRKTGVRVTDKKFALLLDFRGRKITRMVKVEDWAEFVDAYRS